MKRQSNKNAITNKKLVKEFKKFFENGVINKVKFCEECGVSTTGLNRVLIHNNDLTTDFFNKIEPTMVKYGFTRYEYVYFKMNKEEKQ